MDEHERRPVSPIRTPTSKHAETIKRLQKLNKEQLAEALKKKSECNAKAQKIVERLLDPIHDETLFLKMLISINQEHFQDIVEERSIMKLCGYPLCDQEVSKIPDQQYHVSVTTKKVYDLSERKHFCSGKCLRSSNYLKSQLLTSPLWLRDTVEIPALKLMPHK